MDCIPQPLLPGIAPSPEAPGYMRTSRFDEVSWRAWVNLVHLILRVSPEEARRVLGREPNDLAHPPCGTCVIVHPNEHIITSPNADPCQEDAL